MASLEQWTTWREDYLWGLRSAIESCAFKFASISTSQRGVAFDYNKAMNLVAEAIEKGYLDESESSYLFKLASFCLFSADNQRRLFSYHAKDALYDYKLHVYKQTDIISSLKNFNGFLGSAFWFVYLPLIDAIGYYTKNHPLVYREWLLKAADGNYDFSYCGLTKAQLFDYFCSMSQYGLYKLFVDNKYRQAEDLFDSVQANDYDRYIRICSESDIDLTKVSEIAGYILNGLSISAFEDGEGSADSKARALFAMVGVRKAEKDEIDKLLHKVYNHEFVCEVLHMDLTEEESFHLTSWAYYVSMYLPYLELFDDDELFELNKVLDNPYFTGFMKIVQFVRLAMNCSIPQKIKLLLSPEEKDRFLPHSIIESIQENIDDRSFTHKTDNASEDSEIDVQDDADMDFSSQITGVSQGLAPKVKNLASRWMTRPYHRMTDDVLVDIISKKIWPELMEDVDGLMWTPQKRNQPTFQKTKIQLAACLLFHAMERAKIAKLPKQEEQDNT